MGKVIAIKLRDTPQGCRLIAFHREGQKRRIKWAVDFDHRDPLVIKAAVEEKEPRVKRTQPGGRSVAEVKGGSDDRRRG